MSPFETFALFVCKPLIIEIPSTRMVQHRFLAVISAMALLHLSRSADCNNGPGQNPVPASCEGACGIALYHLHKYRAATTAKKNSWGKYYNLTARFIESQWDISSSSDDRDEEAPCARKLTIVEIGTAFGGLADRLARVNCVTVTSVDPFLPDYDKKDQQSNIWGNLGKRLNLNSDAFSATVSEAMAFDQHSRHGCHYRLLPMLSANAAPLFEDKSVDFLFVDGLHTKEGVQEDISAWERKLRPSSGVIMFNDYGSKRFTGIKPVVDAWAKQVNRSAACCRAGLAGPYVFMNIRQDLAASQRLWLADDPSQCTELALRKRFFFSTQDPTELAAAAKCQRRLLK